jgi:hypothetical protein
MAVTVTGVLRGATPEMYDRINGEIGVSPGNLPDGLVAHYATRTDEGIRIFDVWESEEQFDQFMQQVVPAMEKTLGEAPQLEPERGQLHNVFARK